MTNTETLSLILEELKTLKGKPLTWENLRWFEFYVEAVREVATPSPMKEALMLKWYWDLCDYKEILIRRGLNEHEALMEKAGDLRFIKVVDEDDTTLGYRLCRV